MGLENEILKEEIESARNLEIGDAIFLNTITKYITEADNHQNDEIIAVYDTIKENDYYVVSAPKDATCKTIILQSNGKMEIISISKNVKNKELLIDLI